MSCLIGTADVDLSGAELLFLLLILVYLEIASNVNKSASYLMFTCSLVPFLSIFTS